MTHTAAELHRRLVNWLFRKAQLAAGRTFPDGRNQEQRDRGAELAWRVRVMLNERKRIQASRDEFSRRGLERPNNVTPIRGGAA